MHTLPPKPTLVQYATTALRDLIARGYWTAQLPSERTLSQQLDISRPTLRAALRNLEQDGLIVRRWGTPWKLSADAQRQSTSGGKKADVPVLLLSPLRLNQMDAVMLYRFERLSEDLAAHGFRIELVAEPKASHAHPPAAVFDRLAALRPVAWLLQHCSPAVQKWFSESSRPALIIGSPAPGVRLMSIDIDFHATGFHAIGRLRALGHEPERIACVFPQQSLPGNVAALEGIYEAMKIARDAANVIRISKGDAELCQELDRLLERPARPTALVFMWPLHALTALTHLGVRRGLRIPQEMSMIVLDDNPILRHVMPAISRYARDNDLLVSKVTHELNRVIQGTVRKSSTVKIIAESIPGETLAPPRV